MTHVTPLDPPLGLRKFWQDLAWSAELDRGGKGSVEECRARLGRPWQIMTGPGMDWRCTGQGKAGLGRTWLGRECLVLVCQQNRGSQDRHRPVYSQVNSLRKVDFSHPTGHYTGEKNSPPPPLRKSWVRPCSTLSRLALHCPSAPVRFCRPSQVFPSPVRQ